MSLEIIILSELRQREIQIPYDVMSMWNLKCGTHETMKQKKNQGQREHTGGCQGRGMDLKFGISRCKLIYIYRMNNFLLYSTENYI